MRVAPAFLAVALAAATAGLAHRVSAGEPLWLAAAGIDDLLSGVDYVPDKPELDEALGDPPEDELIAIATSDATDPGVRVRAYRALAHYPTDPTRVVLMTAIASYQEATSGPEVLYLRAAMHSLAAVSGANAVLVLDDLLYSSSRDIRADAALALGETGSGTAVPLLHARRTEEQVAQVIWAIDEAIRMLNNST